MDSTRARSTRAFALFFSAFFAAASGACTLGGGPPRRPEPEPLGQTQPAPRSSAEQASSANAGVGPRAIPPDPRTPTVEIEDTSGKPKKGPEDALAPLRAQMKECSGGKAGIVRVRVSSAKNRTQMDIEPGSALGGTAHRCVLETLSTIDVDEMLMSGSPSDRPSTGFTSVLRVEW